MFCQRLIAAVIICIQADKLVSTMVPYMYIYKSTGAAAAYVYITANAYSGGRARDSAENPTKI